MSSDDSFPTVQSEALAKINAFILLPFDIDTLTKTFNAVNGTRDLDTMRVIALQKEIISLTIGILTVAQDRRIAQKLFQSL